MSKQFQRDVQRIENVRYYLNFLIGKGIEVPAEVMQIFSKDAGDMVKDLSESDRSELISSERSLWHAVQDLGGPVQDLLDEEYELFKEKVEREFEERCKESRHRFEERCALMGF